MQKYNKYHNKPQPNKITKSFLKNKHLLKQNDYFFKNKFNLNKKILPYLNKKSLQIFLEKYWIWQEQLSNIQKTDLKTIYNIVEWWEDTYKPTILKSLREFWPLNYLIIIAIFLLLSCNDSNNNSNNNQNQNIENIIKKDNSDKVKYDFEKMKKFNNVLVVCANLEEFNWYKNIMEEVWWNQIWSWNWYIKYSYEGKNYNVIRKDFAGKLLDKDEKYKLIQIKWHTGDMLDLLDIVKNQKHEDGCILIMWWCYSEDFRRDAQEYWFVVITNIDEWNAWENDFMGRYIAKNIKNSENLKEFLDKLKIKAPKTYEEYIYPDTTKIQN